MNEYLSRKEELVNSFSSNDSKGLSTEQVYGNRTKYGQNILTRKKNESLFKRFIDATMEPMILMLIGAAIIALLVNIYRAWSGKEADYLECVGIFFAIALSVVISVVMEGKSAKAFEALAKISDNVVVKVIRNGEVGVVPQQDIVVGDIILLSVGDKVPADGRILECTNLMVDESALTGESIAVVKNADVKLTKDTPLAERTNMLYSGTYITNGNCKFIVTAVGDKTEFGKIAGELTGSTKGESPLQQKLSKLGKVITLLGVCAAVIVFISQLISFSLKDGLTLEEAMEAFVTSIVLIVAAVPEGLPTIVAISLSINIIKLSKENALVKKLIASETVGCVNVICSDKTGTLTENKMTVKSYYDKELHTDPTDLIDKYLIHNICINTTADLGSNGSFIGNPTEGAMLAFYEKSQGRKLFDNYQEERIKYDVTQVFPFDSNLKHMTTLVKIDGILHAFTKGSPEHIISMSHMDLKKKAEVESLIANAQKNAMRVIAFAHKILSEELDYSIDENHKMMENNMTFDGFVAISDPLRKEVYSAVKACKKAGISLKILTGDNIITAKSIANELNLLESGEALESKDIENLSDEELLKKLPNICVIARSTPAVKLRIVKLLKSQGNVVAVTGDGINDAPALKNADVGIAMGISGTEVSKEASEIVLLDDSFATIVKAIEWGRNIYENFKRFISFQLTVNVASVIVVLMSVLMGLDAPFTALELLVVNIIMDGPPALTLGLEPNYDDLMTKKPTGREENIISKPMFIRIFTTGILISIIFLVQYKFNFLNISLEKQNTALFTLFVLFQLFNAFNCRELHNETIFKHLLKNKIMLTVMGITFFLLVIIIQFGGPIFNTVPLDFITWIKIILLSINVITISEIVKLVIRLSKNN